VKTLLNTLSKAKQAASHFTSNYWAIACVTVHLFYIGDAHAQLDKIKLPTNIKVDGIDEESNILDIIIGVVKVVAQIGIWLIIIIAGLSLLKNIIKSINRVMDSKNNEGGVKWGEVIGDIIGNAVILVLILLVGVWLQSYF
jgi:hypothetical protein